MDNQAITHIIKTTLTGTIEGRAVIVDFENKPGELPTSVNAFCKDSLGLIIVLNVGATYVESNTLTIIGTVIGDITTLLAEMKSTVEAILING